MRAGGVIRVFLLAVWQLAAGSAHACMFVKDVPPAQWYDWAAALFAGEVTRVEQDERKVDVITVRVSETFKGPAGAAATLRVPSRMWTSCRMELPAVGAQVLVALNANNDTALVPLRADHAGALRARRTNGAPGGPGGGRSPSE
jgi:hypothetical protein